jgi:glutamine synthetase
MPKTELTTNTTLMTMHGTTSAATNTAAGLLVTMPTVTAAATTTATSRLRIQMPRRRWAAYSASLSVGGLGSGGRSGP